MSDAPTVPDAPTALDALIAPIAALVSQEFVQMFYKTNRPNPMRIEPVWHVSGQPASPPSCARACIKRAFLVALLLLISTSESALARVWTVKEVCAQAVRASFLLQQAEARVRETREVVEEARLPERSTVSATASYTYVAPTFSFGQPPAAVQAVVDNNLAGTLTWRQLLSTFGQLEATVAASRLAVTVAQLQLRDSEQRVVEDARVAFQEAAQAEELLRVAEETLIARQEALRESQAQYRAGVVSRYDVLRARTNVALASQTCVDTRRDVRACRVRLFQLMGVPDTAAESIDLSEALLERPPTSVDDAMQSGVERRYEVRAAQAGVAEGRKRVDVARLSSAPRLEVQSEYLQRTPTGVMQGHQWNTGLALSVPLIDGGAARVHARRAYEAYQQLIAALEQTRRQARIEIGTCYEDLQARYADLGTSEAALESAREAARVSRIRYENGLCTSLERQDADASLSDAQGRCVRARRAYAITWARWLRVSGAEITEAAPAVAAPAVLETIKASGTVQRKQGQP